MTNSQLVDLSQALDIGVKHIKNGNYDKAEKVYNAILDVHPNNSDAFYFLSQIAVNYAKYDLAIELLGKANQYSPNNFHIMLALGDTYHRAKQYDNAKSFYEKAIELKPTLLHYAKLGELYRDMGDAEKSKEIDEQAIEIHKQEIKKSPDNIDVLFRLGQFYQSRDKNEEAIDVFQQLEQLKNDVPDYSYNISFLHSKAGDFAKALEINDGAIKRFPGHLDTVVMRGVIFIKTGRLEEAEKWFLKALEIAPGIRYIMMNLASVYKRLNKHQQAIDLLTTIHQHYPNDPTCLDLLAKIYVSQGCMAEATNACLKALEVDSENKSVLAMAYYTFRYVCAWGQRAKYRDKVKAFNQERIDESLRPYCAPLDEVMETMDLKFNLDFAKAWTKELEDEVATYNVNFDFSGRSKTKKKLKIAYISNDFRAHAVSYLTRSMFQYHDRDKFHVVAYSYSVQNQEECRKHIVNSVDEFVEIGHLSNQDAAQKIFDDEIDILIDLNGYTANVRSEIVAQRPAPLVISYLGFIGTSGASFYDYIIGDEIVTPVDEAEYYTEKLLLMPECYQVNDDSPVIADQPLSRADFGLTDDDIVFCTYNQAIKFEPVMFDVWLNIMKRVPESKFMIFSTNTGIEQNLSHYANEHGVDPSRLIFVGNIPNNLYLKRIGLADLSLDTRIYNGGTITSNCLYMGVPVVTLKGEHFASRMATSILTNHGVPELVTHSLEEYEELVVSLCKDPKKLKALKQKVKANVATEPLFNTKRFVKHLDQAYQLAWQRYEAGDEADHIKVPLLEG